MTRDDLEAWAARNGRVLIDIGELEELCDLAAASILSHFDFDRDIAALFGTDH